MRRFILAALAGLGLSGPVAAQDWRPIVTGAEGEVGAMACAPTGAGTGDLCLTLSCPSGAGIGLEAGLILRGGDLPDRVSAAVTVDGQPAGRLDFANWDGEVLALLDGQEDLLRALRTGDAATVTLDKGAGGLTVALGLGGSGAAIGAAQAACSSGEVAGDLPALQQRDDPAARAIALNEEGCAGATTVEDGLVRQVDVDADGVNDVIVDYIGLTCNGFRPYCGTGGCTQEVWLGDRDGPYRLLLSDLIERIEFPEPGTLRLILDGGECGLSGAEACEFGYSVRDGRLVPAG